VTTRQLIAWLDSTPTPSQRQSRTRLLIVGGLVVLGVLAVFYASRSTGFVWDDDYKHLVISRAVTVDWRWLLDIWGRPLTTAIYVPAGILGEGAARVTSLLLLGGGAACVAAAAKASGRRFPWLAALFLLAQPLTIRLGYSAMPQILFVALYAAGLALRARGRNLAAAVVLALLPLARLEGIVALAVMGALALRERRPHHVLVLGWALALWVIAAWATYGDPLWLLHANPWANTTYPLAGSTFYFWALPTALGLPVVVLAGIGFLKGSLRPEIGATFAALSCFYVAVWTIPGTPSFPTPLYLVSLGPPVALAAHAGTLHLIDRGTPYRQVGRALAIGGVVATALTMSAIPQTPVVRQLEQATSALRDPASHVTLSTHPAGDWLAGRRMSTTAVQQPQEGTVALIDSKYGGLPVKPSKYQPQGWIIDEIYWESGRPFVGVLRCAREEGCRELERLGPPT
jgi:hypothetical protein